MKNIISVLIVLFFSFPIFAQEDMRNEELGWVDQQVKAILPERVGIDEGAINSIQQPFIFLELKKDKNGMVVTKKVVKSYKGTSSSLHLKLIINSQALIGHRWYSLNDRILGYKIIAIDKASVKLVKNGKIKVLSIKTNVNKIKIYTK